MARLTGALLLSNVATSAAHAAMNVPASWQDEFAMFGMSDYWRLAGCKNLTKPWEETARGCIGNYFTNHTFIPGEPTIGLDSPFKTFYLDIRNVEDDTTRNYPWRAPGTAPLHSPCGVDGGNPKGCPAGNDDPLACGSGGYGWGPDARAQKGNSKPTEWTIGEVHEVQWGFHANHGGGYQFRLCKKPANLWELTEECFAKMPLKLLGTKTWIQYFGHPLMRTEIQAQRLTEGVYPEGSQWTKNPIPACGGKDGGVFDFHCLAGSQFPPPAPGVTGFWGVYNLGNPTFGRGKLQDMSIVDQVLVPDSIPPGDYVIQFRYDSEFQPSVFNTCGDVRVMAPKAATSSV